MKAGFITLIWKQNDSAWNGITALPSKKPKTMPSEHKTMASVFFFFWGGGGGKVKKKCWSD